MYNQLTFIPTYQCNLSCPMCFQKGMEKELKNAAPMTWEEFTTAIDSIKKQDLNLHTISFSGGEATLWPYLKEAIILAKTVCKNVRVVSNAVGKKAEDFGEADEVRISHYGAINRYYMQDIKKNFKGRVSIQYVVHLPVDEMRKDLDPSTLPARCSCLNYVVIRNRVYQCGMFAGSLETPYLTINEYQWGEFFRNSQLLNHDMCMVCLANKNVRDTYTTSATLEAGIWDTHIGGIFSVPSKLLWLRKVYSKILRRTTRR